MVANQELKCSGGLHFEHEGAPGKMQTASWATFWMPFESKGAGMFEVHFYLLPDGGKDPASVWHDNDTFPWRGADNGFGLDEGYNEQFIVP